MSSFIKLPNIDVEHVKSSRTWWCFRSRMTLPLWPQKLPIFEATLYSIHNWTMAIAKRSSNHYGICTHSSTNSLWTHFFGNSDIRGPKMHKYFIALPAYIARLSSFSLREGVKKRFFGTLSQTLDPTQCPAGTRTRPATRYFFQYPTRPDSVLEIIG